MIPNQRASSFVEYMALFIMVMAALYMIQHYVVRGLQGRWRATGDVFGHGQQYDPRSYGWGGSGGGTRECRYIPQVRYFVEETCYEETARNGQGCDCDTYQPGTPEFREACSDCAASCGPNNYASCRGN